MKTDAEEGEIKLLDLLLLGAGNLRLLILGPVVVGLLALAMGDALPQRFTSQAALNLGEPGRATDAAMHTPTVLEAMTRSPAILAALGSGFAWLLWVFFRQGWKHAAFDPQAAEEQARPRTFFGFKGLSLQSWTAR